MRSSRWHAQGNVYLVTEDALTADDVRARGRRRRRHPRGPRPRRRLGRDRDLEPRRLAGGDVRQRHAHRRALARRADGRRRSPSASARARSRAHARRTASSSRTWARSPSASRRRSPASASHAVDVGNPHAVVEGDPDDLPRIGPLLETHQRFPNRTNVQVARRLGDGEIEARVWERGVGETASSGTSAVAVAAAFGCRARHRPLPGRPARRALRGAPSVPVRAGAENPMKVRAVIGLTIAIMLLGAAGSSHASSTSCKVAVVFTNMPPSSPFILGGNLVGVAAALGIERLGRRLRAQWAEAAARDLALERTELGAGREQGRRGEPDAALRRGRRGRRRLGCRRSSR